MNNPCVNFAHLKTWNVASILLLIILNSSAWAEDLCQSRELRLVSSDKETAVYLKGNEDVRLIATSSCNARTSCNYSLQIYSGSGYKSVLDDLEIHNICVTTQLSISTRSTNQDENRGNIIGIFSHVSTSEFVFQTNFGDILITDFFYNYGNQEIEWGQWDSDTDSGQILEAPVHIVTIFTGL